MKPTDEDKKQILGKIEEAFDQEAPFLILTESSPEAAVMMGGDKKSLSRMLSIAMSKIPELESIVKYARKALKHARISSNRDSKVESELLKCETCKKKDDCVVRSLKEKLMSDNAVPTDIMELLKTLTEEHGPITDLKIKGEC
jgi:hypothetical protein